MNSMKTPGVYIVEKSAFPNSVAEVETAVPAFIGYTEKAVNGDKSLSYTPWRITSLAEYVQFFGEGPVFQYAFSESDGTGSSGAGSAPNVKTEADTTGKAKYYTVKRTDKFSFYQNMKFFFANGGGTCYIVSVGNYNDELNPKKLEAGINFLIKEQEPTILVVPEAVNLDMQQDCYNIQQKMLQHCGTMQNRVAILDIYNGNKDRKDTEMGDMVATFRQNIGLNYLNYAAAYYPFLNTSVVSDSEINFSNINKEGLPAFKSVLISDTPELKETIDEIGNEAATKESVAITHKKLLGQSKLYAGIIKEMLQQVNVLPPSAAMAGIYTFVDHNNEVWKAPANASIKNVISPTVNINYSDQEDLNVPLDGKAVNALRSFTGEGILVWGARTLDGNSIDWRYINVRRTMIMLEESIKCSVKAYVFEPNVASTWVSIRSMITNFLTGIWKRGGLAGATPADAFSVNIGLGVTMTPEDILTGILRITVLVALTRPAEFIEITFEQQMQKS